MLRYAYSSQNHFLQASFSKKRRALPSHASLGGDGEGGALSGSVGTDGPPQELARDAEQRADAEIAASHRYGAGAFQTTAWLDTSVCLRI